MKVTFRRILCATDLSDFSNAALLQAMEMAREFGARLFVCHVIDLPVVSMHGAAFVYPDHQIEEMRAAALEQIRALCGTFGPACEPLVETGPVSSTICRLAAEKAVDLAIVSTHGLTGLKRLFLGSVTERLLRTIACPLMVVTAPEGGHQKEMRFKGFGFRQILVGCDFSPSSLRAVDYGLSLAQEFEAAIHLVHVVEPFVYRDTMLPETVGIEALAVTASACRERLEALVPPDVHNWCNVKVDCQTGKPFVVLSDYAADEPIDLVVLGVRGYSLVETMLLGSTTDRVIRRVACPVLSVNSP